MLGKTGSGEQKAQRHAVIRMPCSSRACRLENELTNGSLGTIFLFPPPFHLMGYSRATLAKGWSRDFIPGNDLLQTVGALRIHGHSSWFRWSGRPLIRHLGGCTACHPKSRDPNDQDRRLPHARCEALHIC